MVNRSKKVVLSARVEPYLKDALELLAVSRNQKIVKLLETFLENSMSDWQIPNPLHWKNGQHKKISYLSVFAAIWSENRIIYELRAGALGPEFAGEELWEKSVHVLSAKYFEGTYDLFGDLNGATERYGFEPLRREMIDLDRVEREWTIIEGYVDFLRFNKPFSPSYEDYKRMLEDSKSE